MKYAKISLLIAFSIIFMCSYVNISEGNRKLISDPYNVSPLMCSYVNDLIVNGCDILNPYRISIAAKIPAANSIHPIKISLFIWLLSIMGHPCARAYLHICKRGSET